MRLPQPVRRDVLPGALVAALLLAGCAAPAAPIAAGRETMLARTHVAASCDEAARNHDRPFVVEWDATDLASFEAKAARDAIFVRYEGCALEVLYGCSDASVPGRFGRYGAPHFTSGTLQGFDVRDEGELYAKLPLGAASLSSRVRAGQSLRLRYFVSGVATATRDALYRGEIAAQAGCARATHFVWSYNLGAFELASGARASAEAQAGIGSAGVGGSARHEEESLGNGGDLASCRTQDQRGCRVPIRLALRRIEDGEHPAGAGAVVVPGAAPVAGDGVAQWNASPAGQAYAAVQDAIAKHASRDGEACLRSIDRALALDPRSGENMGFVRAQCLMMAGRCDEGARDLRGVIASRDTARTRSDEDIGREVRATANRNCASASATTDADFVVRASVELLDAVKAVDGARCRSIAGAMLERMPRLGRTPDDLQASSTGKSTLDEGAFCVARAGRCADGLALYQRSYALKLPNMSGVDKIAAQAWETSIVQRKIECR
ncbi:MAG: hypothetical protein AABZ30_14835 [Myxococcota bacterium]